MKNFFSLFNRTEEISEPVIKTAELDESVRLMNGCCCGDLLKNPDRGLRMETYITLGEKIEAYPTDGEEPYEKLTAFFEKYEEDSPTLCQVYVYLCNYNDRELDETAFSQLKRFFELFRERGVRMLLRFTYQTEAVDDAPWSIVKTHLAQIKKWFSENEELINDTLYCLQTGIVGYWGEGHTYHNFKARHIPDAIAGVCDIAPEGIYNQVRTYDMLKKVKKEYLPRVGIHDDYLIGDVTHQWSFIPKNEKNLQKYNWTTAHARSTVNDAEMPWGGSTLNDSADGASLDTLDGRAILGQLSAYSLTSLSLEHNYREVRNDKPYRGPYSLGIWKNEYLGFDEAREAGLSPNPNLFKDADGNEKKMSIYDIIRYHLGYQLVLSNLKESDGLVSFTVTNFGVAAPLNFNYFALVTEDGNGALHETEIASYDRKALLPGDTEAYTASVPAGERAVGVKLSTLKGRKQCVRFANDAQFKNGVQYFK